MRNTRPSIYSCIPQMAIFVAVVHYNVLLLLLCYVLSLIFFFFFFGGGGGVFCHREKKYFKEIVSPLTS